MAYKNIEDRKAYHRNWYIKNREARSQQIYLHRKKKRKRYLSKIVDYLLVHPCVDCGMKDIIVLEFDHERDKAMDVTTMIKNLYPWETIEKEIAKCSVRCANCHRRKTYKGSYKDLPM